MEALFKENFVRCKRQEEEDAKKKALEMERWVLGGVGEELSALPWSALI